MFFSSKKDNWVTIIIWGMVIYIGWICVSEPEFIDLQKAGIWDVVLFIICISTIIFLLSMFYNTGYLVKSGVIKIKSGFLKSQVKIKDIREIKASRTLLSAPALSLDRLEIKYNRYDFVIISPADKVEFCNLLLEENPDIIIDPNIYKDTKKRR